MSVSLASTSRSIISSLGRANFSKYALPLNNTSFTFSWAYLILIGISRDIGALTSLRILRTAVITSWMNCISSVSFSNTKLVSTLANSLVTILSPVWGMCCQISSVTNGINGCNIFREASSTYTKIDLVVFLVASSSPFNEILAISIYHEQNSSHTKLYKMRLASPNSYFSNNLSKSSIVLASFVKIYLSASVFSPDKSISLYSNPSRFIITKREAFQILLI